MRIGVERATEKEQRPRCDCNSCAVRAVAVVWVRVVESFWGLRVDLESFLCQSSKFFDSAGKIFSENITRSLRVESRTTSRCFHIKFFSFNIQVIHEMRERFFTHTLVFMLPWYNEIMRETCRQPKSANHTTEGIFRDKLKWYKTELNTIHLELNLLQIL